jgi:hypothetical protein
VRIRKYALSGDSSIWLELTRCDGETVEQLLNELERIVRYPGETGRQ